MNPATKIRMQVQNTPNPAALKYVLSVDVIAEGKATFTSQTQCADIPLAAGLFEVPGVVQIHFFENYITVTKDEARGWDELDGEVRDTIMALIEDHKIDFKLPGEDEKKERAPLTPELQEINTILDRTIRPGLQMDGGDLEVISLEDNKLTVKWEGACGGCPSAMGGTLYAVENILKDEYDPDLEVVTV